MGRWWHNLSEEDGPIQKPYLNPRHWRIIYQPDNPRVIDCEYPP